jgi:hypothetical protein
MLGVYMICTVMYGNGHALPILKNIMVQKINVLMLIQIHHLLLYEEGHGSILPSDYAQHLVYPALVIDNLKILAFGWLEYLNNFINPV